MTQSINIPEDTRFPKGSFKKKDLDKDLERIRSKDFEVVQQVSKHLRVKAANKLLEWLELVIHYYDPKGWIFYVDKGGKYKSKCLVRQPSDFSFRENGWVLRLRISSWIPSNGDSLKQQVQYLYEVVWRILVRLLGKAECNKRLKPLVEKHGLKKFIERKL